MNKGQANIDTQTQTQTKQKTHTYTCLTHKYTRSNTDQRQTLAAQEILLGATTRAGCEMTKSVSSYTSGRLFQFSLYKCRETTTTTETDNNKI